jgi:hypothetical protein
MLTTQESARQAAMTAETAAVPTFSVIKKGSVHLNLSGGQVDVLPQNTAASTRDTRESCVCASINRRQPVIQTNYHAMPGGPGCQPEHRQRGRAQISRPQAPSSSASPAPQQHRGKKANQKRVQTVIRNQFTPSRSRFREVSHRVRHD